jgi:DNA-binding transcriptional ArsR family regulator
VLRDAGVVEFERQGLWSYYYVLPEALDELTAWLGNVDKCTKKLNGDRTVRLPA